MMISTEEVEKNWEEEALLKRKIKDLKEGEGSSWLLF